MAAQLDFSGGEHPYGPQFNQSADPGLANRLDKAQRNRGVFSTYASRMAAIDERRVSEFGLKPASNAAIAKGAGFHEHATGARRFVGKMEEVPLYNYAEDRPSIRTPQMSVSTDRLAQTSTDSSLGRSPRFPASLQVDVPFAYRPNKGRGDPVLIDGNHRTTGAILQGQMFQPMRTITSRDLPKLRAVTKQINQAKINAEQHTGIAPESGWSHPLTLEASDRLHGETSSSSDGYSSMPASSDLHPSASDYWDVQLQRGRIGRG